MRVMSKEIDEYCKKTIRETIKKKLEVNELDLNIVYDKTLWRNLIHVIDPI